MPLKILETCIEVYELDLAHFLSAPGLAWQVYLRKTDVKLELLTDPDRLLMVEKGIRGGICCAIHRYAKANNTYMKNYDEDEEYLDECLDANNLYGFAMSEPLPVSGFNTLATEGVWALFPKIRQQNGTLDTHTKYFFWLYLVSK